MEKQSEKERVKHNLMSELQYIESFGRNLAFFRKQLNLTQKEIADRLNIGESTYANWEQGRRAPNIYFIMNLAEVLEIDYNSLFTF